MECVSYICVSTQRQGNSGLGLSAQRAAVQQFCNQHGFTMVREFREIESGRKNDRVVLREAIAYAKRAKATLLIAKLDRLARNVAFIANLMESGIDFRACDVPEANRLLLHIMAAVAEAEAKAISDRTRVALQAARERGKRLGATNPRSRNLTQAAMREGRKRGAQAPQGNNRVVGGRKGCRDVAYSSATAFWQQLRTSALCRCSPESHFVRQVLVRHAKVAALFF